MDERHRHDNHLKLIANQKRDVEGEIDVIRTRTRDYLSSLSPNDVFILLELNKKGEGTRVINNLNVTMFETCHSLSIF